MRDNTDIHIGNDNTEPIDIIKIPHLRDFDIMDYDLSDPKDQAKYFEDVKRTCRNSFAYSRLIQFLRDHIDMNQCAFFHNINNIDTTAIKIEIHHSPLTMFDIVTTVYNKRVANMESVSVFDISNEIMRIHYNMLVGLIPLSETAHALVHGGVLFIPTNYVFGNYKKFVSLYSHFMDEKLRRNLEIAEEYTQTYDYAKEKEILDMKMVHIDSTGAYDLPNLEELTKKLKGHIQDFDRKTDMNFGTSGEKKIVMEISQIPTGI